MAKPSKWTAEEIAALKEHYPERGPSWEGWADLLQDRSTGAITAMAHKMRMSSYRDRQLGQAYTFLRKYHTAMGKAVTQGEKRRITYDYARQLRLLEDE